MKSKLYFLPLVLIIASSLRCSDGPTQPPPPALDLNGAWTLTAPGVFGIPVVEGVEVQVQQIGGGNGSVAFAHDRFLRFNGALYQGALTGQVFVSTPFGTYPYKRVNVSGTATSTRISLTGNADSLSLTLTR